MLRAAFDQLLDTPLGLFKQLARFEFRLLRRHHLDCDGSHDRHRQQRDSHFANGRRLPVQDKRAGTLAFHLHRQAG